MTRQQRKNRRATRKANRATTAQRNICAKLEKAEKREEILEAWIDVRRLVASK